jgi:uncharacterized Zn finger protein
MLLRIRDLYIRLDQDAQWTAYLAGLRTVHKAKRNFMAALAQRGL